MPLAERLLTFLQANGAEYTVTAHPRAFTAREVAQAEHLPAREVAKTVVIFGDGRYHMVVVPSNKLVDFGEVRLRLELSEARLATEEELAKLFPDCELGAMPPFGKLYGCSVYLDAALNGEEMIAFNGGTHSDVIHMRTADFRKLTDPAIVSLVREPAVGQGG